MGTPKSEEGSTPPRKILACLMLSFYLYFAVILTQKFTIFNIFAA